MVPSRDLSHISTILCDLDGVVWLAHRPIAGSVEAIAALRASGRRVLFVTNNSVALLAEHEAALRAIGVEARGDVVSSATAAAHLVTPGERVLVTGGPGIVEAIERRGAIAVANSGEQLAGAFDAVVVGLDRSFDYQRLRIAGAAVLDGARLIGTNADSTYPTPTGLEPGGGSIIAAVATVGGVRPIFAGKPEQPMADATVEMIGRTAADTSLVVGDRPETDGLFAERLGAAFALVESGVTMPGDPIGDVVVDLRLKDLAAVVRVLD